MGILYEIMKANTSTVSLTDIYKLNSRGIYPVVRSGRIVGFSDDDGKLVAM